MYLQYHFLYERINRKIKEKNGGTGNVFGDIPTGMVINTTVYDWLAR